MRANYFRDVTNAAPGTVNLSPSALNMTINLGINGAAGLRSICLRRQGVDRGTRMTVMVGLPATAGIVLDFRDDVADGTALLPSDTFPDSTFTSDGYVTSATFEFVYKGFGNWWKYVESSIPS